MKTISLPSLVSEIEYPVERWISRKDAESVAYSDYWNNEALEAEKDWNIFEKGFGEMEGAIAEEGFANDIRKCREALHAWTGTSLSGSGIDLAAGCLWAVPILLDMEGINHIYCLEFSEHRLLKLGPHVLTHYGVPKSRVTLVYGSFYDLQLPSESLDFALLASAFHHADNPLGLLNEIRRVLKPGGKVIITGEPRITVIGQYLKYGLRLVLPRMFSPRILQKILGREIMKADWPPMRQQVFPVDPILGDHLYTVGEYAAFFSATGFRFLEVPAKKMRAFVLIRD